MAPGRGRRKKVNASPAKPAIATKDDTTSEQIESDTVNNISSINPKEENNDQGIQEEVVKSKSTMEIDESVLQSSEHCSVTQPSTDADSQLLYEGDDGFNTDVNHEVSYAPEDVDALLGDDDNEGLDNAVEEFVTGDETTYDGGEGGGDFTESGDLQEDEEENTDVKDAKAKAKLVKTTYHYVTDKTEEKPGK